MWGQWLGEGVGSTLGNRDTNKWYSARFAQSVIREEKDKNINLKNKNKNSSSNDTQKKKLQQRNSLLFQLLIQTLLNTTQDHTKTFVVRHHSHHVLLGNDVMPISSICKILKLWTYVTEQDHKTGYLTSFFKQPFIETGVRWGVFFVCAFFLSFFLFLSISFFFFGWGDGERKL